MACKLKGGNGTLIWTSLIVSVVFSCEVTIASPSISNMCSISVFELLCVLRSAFRMLRAVRILFPNPTHVICFGWVSDPYYSISSVCVCRYYDIWLWFISWKASQSSLLAATKLVPLSDLITRKKNQFLRNMQSQCELHNYISR